MKTKMFVPNENEQESGEQESDEQESNEQEADEQESDEQESDEQESDEQESDEQESGEQESDEQESDEQELNAFKFFRGLGLPILQAVFKDLFCDPKRGLYTKGIKTLKDLKPIVFEIKVANLDATAKTPKKKKAILLSIDALFKQAIEQDEHLETSDLLLVKQDILFYINLIVCIFKDEQEPLPSACTRVREVRNVFFSPKPFNQMADITLTKLDGIFEEVIIAAKDTITSCVYLDKVCDGYSSVMKQIKDGVPVVNFQFSGKECPELKNKIIHAGTEDLQTFLKATNKAFSAWLSNYGVQQHVDVEKPTPGIVDLDMLAAQCQFASPDPIIIFIIGTTDIGRSVGVRGLAQQWLHRTNDLMRRYQMCLFVDMNQASSSLCHNFYSYFRTEMPKTAQLVHEHQFAAFLAAFPSILVIVDGFNECYPDKLKLLEDIVTKNKTNKILVTMTADSYKTADSYIAPLFRHGSSSSVRITIEDTLSIVSDEVPPNKEFRDVILSQSHLSHSQMLRLKDKLLLDENKSLDQQKLDDICECYLLNVGKLAFNKINSTGSLRISNAEKSDLFKSDLFKETTEKLRKSLFSQFFIERETRPYYSMFAHESLMHYLAAFASYKDELKPTKYFPDDNEQNVHKFSDFLIFLVDFVTRDNKMEQFLGTIFKLASAVEKGSSKNLYHFWYDILVRTMRKPSCDSLCDDGFRLFCVELHAYLPNENWCLDIESYTHGLGLLECYPFTSSLSVQLKNHPQLDRIMDEVEDKLLRAVKVNSNHEKPPIKLTIKDSDFCCGFLFSECVKNISKDVHIVEFAGRVNEEDMECLQQHAPYLKTLSLQLDTVSAFNKFSSILEKLLLSETFGKYVELFMLADHGFELKSLLRLPEFKDSDISLTVSFDAVTSDKLRQVAQILEAILPSCCMNITVCLRSDERDLTASDDRALTASDAKTMLEEMKLEGGTIMVYTNQHLHRQEILQLDHEARSHEASPHFQLKWNDESVW